MFTRGYIEVLFKTADTPLSRELEAARARYPGVHLAAFTVADAAAAHRRLAERGFRVRPLVHMQRPVETGVPPGTAAFTLARVEPGEMPEGGIQSLPHRPEAMVWQPRWLSHPNGALALASIVIAVADVEEAARRFARFTDREVKPSPLGPTIELDRGCVQLVTADAFARKLPEVAIPSLPFVGAYAIRVASLAVTGDMLKRADLRTRRSEQIWSRSSPRNSGAAPGCSRNDRQQAGITAECASSPDIVPGPTPPWRYSPAQTKTHSYVVGFSPSSLHDANARRPVATPALQRRHRFRRCQCRVRARRQGRVHGFRALADLCAAASKFVPFRRGVEGLGSARRESRRPRVSRHRRLSRGLLGGDPRRHRPDPCQYAAHGRAICLSARRQPRRGDRGRGCARADRAVDPRSSAAFAFNHRRRDERAGAAGCAGRAFVRGRAGAGRADAVHRVDDVGRGRVVDVHVGLDRRAQGGQARSYQPDGDGEAHGTGHHRHP